MEERGVSVDYTGSANEQYLTQAATGPDVTGSVRPLQSLRIRANLFAQRAPEAIRWSGLGEHLDSVAKAGGTC